jgi:hypothetical protein
VTANPSGRIVAGILLLAGGFVVGVSALAIATAKAVVDGGVAVSASDAALLDDLVAVLPFIAGFAAVNVAAAIGLLAERDWAPSIAGAAATIATITGFVGLVLLIVGRDPFAPITAAGPSTEGVGILVAFTVLYAVILMALAAARPRATSITGAAA